MDPNTPTLPKLTDAEGESYRAKGGCRRSTLHMSSAATKRVLNKPCPRQRPGPQTQVGSPYPPQHTSRQQPLSCSAPAPAPPNKAPGSSSHSGVLQRTQNPIRLHAPDACSMKGHLQPQPMVSAAWRVSRSALCHAGQNAAYQARSTAAHDAAEAQYIVRVRQRHRQRLPSPGPHSSGSSALQRHKRAAPTVRRYASCSAQPPQQGPPNYARCSAARKLRRLCASCVYSSAMGSTAPRHACKAAPLAMQAGRQGTPGCAAWHTQGMTVAVSAADDSSCAGSAREKRTCAPAPAHVSRLQRTMTHHGMPGLTTTAVQQRLCVLCFLPNPIHPPSYFSCPASNTGCQLLQSALTHAFPRLSSVLVCPMKALR